MGSLLGKIADEHRDFERWCEDKKYPFPSREFWKHQPYYDEYMLPERERDKKNKLEWEQKKKLQREQEGDKIGLLSDRFLLTSEVDMECDCGNNKMRYIPGFLLTSEYGCAKCGNVIGGEW